MSLFSFGVCSNKLLDIIITFILLALRNQIQEKTKDKMNNIYFNYFLVCIGQICSIFLFIIQKHLSKSNLTENKEKIQKKEGIRISRLNQEKRLIHQNSIEIKLFPSNNRKEYCLLIFLSSILGLFTSLFLYSIGVSIGEIPIFFILTTLILSNIIFQDIYSRHHYCCLIIIFLSCLVHILNDIFHNTLDGELYHFIVLFFVSIIYGIQVVIQKYLMEILFISPFALLTIQGIISTILLLIICFILTFFNCNELLLKKQFCYLINEPIFNFRKMIDYINNIENYLIIIYFIIPMLYYNMKTIVIFFWSPCHFGVVLSLTELGNIVMNTIELFLKKEDDKKTIIYVIIDSTTHIIYIITTFIFCEFIIINCFNLNYNTEIEIHNRNVCEVKQMIVSDDDDSRSNETNEEIDL